MNDNDKHALATAAYLWNVCQAVTLHGGLGFTKGLCDDAARLTYLRFGTIPAEEATTRFPYLIDYFGEAA